MRTLTHSVSVSAQQRVQADLHLRKKKKQVGNNSLNLRPKSVHARRKALTTMWSDSFVHLNQKSIFSLTTSILRNSSKLTESTNPDIYVGEVICLAKH